MTPATSDNGGITVCVATGKRRYDRSTARREAAWWRRRWLASMSAYRCTSCGAWHIGNSGRPHRRRRR